MVAAKAHARYYWDWVRVWWRCLIRTPHAHMVHATDLKPGTDGKTYYVLGYFHKGTMYVVAEGYIP